MHDDIEKMVDGDNIDDLILASVQRSWALQAADWLREAGHDLYAADLLDMLACTGLRFTYCNDRRRVIALQAYLLELGVWVSNDEGI